MRELEYPFDADRILLNKKKWKRMLLESTDDFVCKKIAVLGGFTTHGIVEILELFLLNDGIRAEFYESGYNQFYQDAAFENDRLKEFAPDMIYLCTSNHNITRYPQLSQDADEIDQMLQAESGRFRNMWDSLRDRYHCPVIQNNFEMPFYRLLGNKDASDIHGRVNYLTRLNMEFYSYAQKHDDFYICDIQYLSADYGLKEWSDPFYYYMYKYALHVNAFPELAFQVANMIKSVFGKNKKGIVLDLDNTLWGGEIGEDGVEHIVLGPEDPVGQAYLEFQKYIKKQLQLGVIAAIASKNDLENALAGLHHPDSILKEEDFVKIRADWNPKDENLKRIAKELGLMPESLVFVDDNPAERDLVSGQLPGVSVPDIGSVHQYIRVLDRSGFFEVTAWSGDDAMRNRMYKENAIRQSVQARFTDYQEYLASLEMKGTIRPFEAVYLTRIAQLSNKTNQFHLTARRYTQPELETMMKDPAYLTLYGRLKDRFGDNGVVTAVIGRMEGRECRIELWMMSCRVLKRGLEDAVLDVLVQHCMEKGADRLRGYYYPTAKNGMVRDFYAQMGFEKVLEDEKGNTQWLFPIRKDYQNKNRVIQLEEEAHAEGGNL